MLKILIITSGTVQNMLLFPLSKILNNKYNFKTSVINVNKLTNLNKISSYFINIRLFKPIKYHLEYFNILRNLKILKPDIVITGFHFGSPFIEACKRLNIKNVLWDMDGIYFYGHSLDEFKNYDFIFTVGKFSEKIFNKLGVRSGWLPLAFDPEIFKPLYYKRKLDIFFAGSPINLPFRTNNYRKYLILLIEKYGHKLYLAGSPKWRKTNIINACKYLGEIPYKHLNLLYNLSKINLNILRDDAVNDYLAINSRFFEILGSGSFQISSEIKGIHELFEINKEIVIARSPEEMLELVEYYLNNEEKRLKIANRGYRKAIEYHTIEKRAEVISKIIKKL
jgi:spore maturation protein CgeB